MARGRGGFREGSPRYPFGRECRPDPCLHRASRRPSRLRPQRGPGGQGSRRRGGGACREPAAAGARAGGRGARAPPHLRADDAGDECRLGSGDHDRARQHASLRAAPGRDPGGRRDLRPHGHHQGVRHRGHRLRHRHGAGPHPRLGDLPGRRAARVEEVRPQGADPGLRVVGGQRPRHARGVAGRHTPARRARHDASGRPREHDPRPLGQAAG